MNKHLQHLLQIIEQDTGLSEDQKIAARKSLKDADKELEITAFKLDRTEKVKHTTAVLLEETIAELELKRKSVESQKRELEIEAALEKVRSRSLAMHQSDELQEVINTVFDRLGDLGIETNTASIIIHKEGSNHMEQWIQNDERTISSQRLAPFHQQSKLGRELEDSIRNRKDLLSRLYTKEKKMTGLVSCLNIPILKALPMPGKNMFWKPNHIAFQLRPSGTGRCAWASTPIKYFQSRKIKS